MKNLTGIGVVVLGALLGTGCVVRAHRGFGPPPPPPPPGMMMDRGYGRQVWVPAHDRWTGRHYRRVEGRWMTPPRPGMVWVPGYRERRHGGYVWIEGYWR